MTSKKTRALAIFVITAIALGVIFFTLPINIFEGEIHVVEPKREYVVTAQLSLSNFIGIGYDEIDMEFVDSFNLTNRGWATAAILILGFPGVLAYRIYLKSIKS